MLSFIPIFSTVSSFSFLSANIEELKTISSGLLAFESLSAKKRSINENV